MVKRGWLGRQYELEGVLGYFKYVLLPHFRSRTLRTVPNDVKPSKTHGVPEAPETWTLLKHLQVVLDFAVLHTVNLIARISKYDFRIRGTILGQKNIFSKKTYFYFGTKKFRQKKNENYF